MLRDQFLAGDSDDEIQIQNDIDIYAEDMQHLIAVEFNYKENFAGFNNVIKNKDRKTLSILLALKNEGLPTKLLLLAAELGELSACQYIIEKGTLEKLTRETPGTNFLFSITRCNDDDKRKALLKWLYDNYETLPIWKPFTDTQILAALGAKDYVYNDELQDGSVVLYDPSTDNLGLTCKDYYLGCGHYYTQIRDRKPLVELSTDDIFHYILGPFNLTSLGDYLEYVLTWNARAHRQVANKKYHELDFLNRTQPIPEIVPCFIDYNAKLSADGNTLAWHIVYQTVMSWEVHSSLLECIFSKDLKNHNIDLNEVGKVKPITLREPRFEDIKDTVKHQYFAKRKTCQELLLRNEITLFSTLLLLDRYSDLAVALSKNRDFKLDFNAPLIASNPTFGSIIDHLKRDKNAPGIQDFYYSVIERSPENIIPFAKSLEFSANLDIFRLFTFILAQRKHYKELRLLLEKGLAPKLERYNRRPKDIKLKNPTVCIVNFFESLLQLGVPDDIISKILDENDFLELFQVLDEKILCAIIAKLYTLKKPEIAEKFSTKVCSSWSTKSQTPQPTKVTAHYPLTTEPKKSPTKKEKTKPSAPASTPSPVIKLSLSPEEELIVNLKKYFGNQYQYTSQANSVSVTIEGNIEYIKKISDVTKKYESKTIKIDRAMILKGKITVTGNIKPLNEFFKNGMLTPIFAQDRKKNTSQEDEDGKAKSEMQSVTKPIITLSGEKREEFKKTLHKAFCEAEQVKVSWDDDLKHFIISVDTRATTWRIKGNQERHVESYDVTCTPVDLEKFILKRVTSFLSNLKELTCNFKNNQYLIILHDTNLPSLLKLNADVQNQFLQWPHTVITKKKKHAKKKPLHSVTAFFEKQDTSPAINPPRLEPKPIYENQFKQFLSDIFQVPLEKFHFLEQETINKSKFKFTFSSRAVQHINHCMGTHNSLIMFRSLTKVLNKYLKKESDIIYIQEEDPARVMLFLAHNDFDSLTEREKFREDYLKEYQTQMDKAATFKNASDTRVSIAPPVITIPPEPKSPAVSNPESQISNDRSTLEAAIKVLASKADDSMTKNVEIHLLNLDNISELYSKVKNPYFFYPYLLHATRLFVILSYLSYDEGNQNNIFCLWRNVLRHAHYKQDFEDLQEKISFVTNMIKEQICLYLPNIKVIKNGSLTIEKIKHLRDMLKELQLPNEKSHCLLLHFQSELTAVKEQNTCVLWQKETVVMLTSLIEQYTPHSDRWLYKHVGHNNVYDVGPDVKIIPKNLRMPFVEFLNKVYQKITEPELNSLRRTY